MNSVSDVVDDFPNEGKIYLNNASVSLMPNTSIKAMTDFLVSYYKMGPDSLEADSFIKEKFVNTRNAISKLLHCKPEEVVLTQSTTDGINIVANGLTKDAGTNIVIRGMGHEHHANYFPWLHLSKKIKLKSLEIDDDGFFKMKEFYSSVDKNTKLVVLSHALYNTGAILPVEEIGEFLEKNNIPYFLDTAQTVGCIGNYDFNKTKCNFMAFTGSKWLCGPMGTGVFYCRRDSSNLLEPPEIGGESAMLYDENKLAYKDLPDKFQTGFRNYVGIVGLEASISYLLQFGLEQIHTKIMRLANLLREELSKIKGVVLYGPEEEQKRTSIVSFTMDYHEVEKVVAQLEKQKMVLAVREILDKKIVRASPHFFNNDTEILKVVESIKRL